MTIDKLIFKVSDFDRMRNNVCTSTGQCVVYMVSNIIFAYFCTKDFFHQISYISINKIIKI